MLSIDLNEKTGVVTVEPQGQLSGADFSELTSVVDGYLAEHDSLQGIIIHTEDFPGWESLAAMLEHLRFVRDHHRQLARVALVTDSVLGTIAEKIAAHFVAAELQHFEYGDLDQARAWVAA